MRHSPLVATIWLAAAIASVQVVASVDVTIEETLQRKRNNRSSNLFTVEEDAQKIDKFSVAFKDDYSLNALWNSGTELDFAGDRFLQESEDLSFSMSIGPSPTPRPPSSTPSPTREGDTAAPSRPPTTVGTLPPTMFVDCLVDTTREDFLLGLFSEITPADVLGDLTTPQGRAFAFIVEDESIDVCTYPTLGQRYALSTFYYSTDGPNWIENTNWVDPGVGECSWFNVTCEENNNRFVEKIQLGKSGSVELFVHAVLHHTCLHRLNCLVFMPY